VGRWRASGFLLFLPLRVDDITHINKNSKSHVSYFLISNNSLIPFIDELGFFCLIHFILFDTNLDCIAASRIGSNIRIRKCTHVWYRVLIKLHLPLLQKH
jgi:hypothetical protein